MRNLLRLPSRTEDDALVRMADWVELTALLSGSRTASREDLRKALMREPDPSEEGETPRSAADQRLEAKVNDVFSELIDRIDSCASDGEATSMYPFALNRTHTVLRTLRDGVDACDLIYLFLLVVTQADMSARTRVRQTVDPTKVFERLCADVLKSFWGGSTPHAGVLIFGTARTSAAGERKFQANINALCKALQEGDGWLPGALAPGGGDGGLDLVVWKRFRDNRQGGLVGFAQCKTGNHWADHLTKLTPRTFTTKYTRSGLALDPLRLYLVPTRISRHRWKEYTQDGGLLFDRCRIVQFAESVSAATLADCHTWLTDVLTTQHGMTSQRTVIV